ncbi:hypothetical protein [Streptomyces sp. NPDC051567]|uniref:hypothetical protein n=1 Tax=Streptomyces sp. NPDC051567 TaxID=3365660 RepID=UPI0037B167DD
MSDPQNTHHYDGPVFHGPVTGNQFAWNNETVTQNQRHNSAVAPAYEELSSLVTRFLQELPEAGLAAAEREEVESAARDVLGAVTGPDAPEEGRLRRALGRLDGALGPVAAGVVAGTAVGAQEWARLAIESLAGIV